MNVLSLFDGISCGQIALLRAHIPYINYYASEIDKYAIKITQRHFPTTIQLGDINYIKGKDLPKIDLLIGGSPCQSFSVLGDGTGFKGKSKLFYEYIRLLEECKPKYFLLENVKMKTEWMNVISNILGIKPIEINSSRISGQHRRRLYWSNMPLDEYPGRYQTYQPQDKHILLGDILEDNVDAEKKYGDFLASNGKTIRIEEDDYPYTFYEARTEEGKKERKRLRELTGKDTTPRSAKYKIYLPLRTGKSNCITATPSQLDYIVDNNGLYRKLTLCELERLQTLPDDYTIGLSNSRRRKLIGNGWTVDVITHLLQSLDSSRHF